jgi:hypothetical protein
LGGNDVVDGFIHLVTAVIIDGHVEGYGVGFRIKILNQETQV